MEKSYYSVQYDAQERMKQYYAEAQNDSNVKEAKGSKSGNLRQMVGHMMVSLGQKVAGRQEIGVRG